MRFPLTVAAVLAAAGLAHARPVPSWTYEKLAAEADLIVIATPTRAKDTGEKANVPYVQRVGKDGKAGPIRAVWVDTTFEVQVVLKGKDDPKEFVLVHLRETEPEKDPVPNGPNLLTLDLKGKKRYLLFLKRSGDKFIPTTGQTDPAWSVKDLGPTP